MNAPDFAPRIAEAIAVATRRPFRMKSSSAVSGGCIHSSMHIEGAVGAEPTSYFAKVNEPDSLAMFDAEADGLEALRKAGAVRVPAVIAKGHDEECAWLALEWLELAPLDAASAALLGKALARQHRVVQESFGWDRDNFIGATRQANGRSDDWLGFFREKRLHAQLRLAARNRLPTRMIDRGERLLADCEAFFRLHRPEASLLHGDLWGGNAAALADGTAVCFDPAVYAGDREADIAMTELFGGFPRDFRAAYEEAWPLSSDYSARRGFYNLYHVLNHANLFSGDYVRQAGDSIERLVAEIA